MKLGPRLLRKLSVADLRQALKMKRTFDKRDKLEAERASLLKSLAKVERKLSKLDGQPIRRASVKPGRKGKRRKMSAETRRKMSEAARKRWAKVKGTQP